MRKLSNAQTGLARGAQPASLALPFAVTITAADLLGPARSADQR